MHGYWCPRNQAVGNVGSLWARLARLLNTSVVGTSRGLRAALQNCFLRVSENLGGVSTRLPKTAIIVLLMLPTVTIARVSGLPAYSGETAWDPSTATFTFKSSGSMPAGKEDFFWQVPAEVKRVVIEKNVTVRGGFRVPFRAPGNPLRIVGADRNSSIIFGTEEQRWTARNDVAENEKWKYGTVSVLADAIVNVSNLTSLNPRGYHVSGYAKRAVLHVSQCNLLDTRPGENNNSDGFVGGAGSTISDCLISTGDDAIKVYHDIVVRNVTIQQHRNGAAIQFGWGGKGGHARAEIENLTVRGVSSDGCYNMAPFTWVAGSGGVRDVHVKGLRVDLTGRLYDDETNRWMPVGLFKLKPTECTFNFTATEADIGVLPPGIIRTKGTISINGKQLK